MAMHYEIVSALKPGKTLTPAQRASGFSECPRIGSVTLRRGVGLIANVEFLKAHKLRIEHLLSSESIEVLKVEGITRVPMTLDAIFKAEEERKKAEEAKKKVPVALDTKKTPEPVDVGIGIANVPLAKTLEYVTEDAKAEALKIAEAQAKPGDLLTPSETVAVAEKVVEAVVEVAKVLGTPVTAPVEEQYGKKGKKKHKQDQ
jgi:hypothetical protein